MEESAKAVQEVAKATGQAIKTVDRLGQFFSLVMSESIDATCGMIADTLKYKRWERQIKLVEKSEALIRKKNLTSKTIPIPPKLALPILQHASLENDDFLHDLYAKLLVTAIDPEIQTRRTAYADIISQLEPLDVRILQEMHLEYEGVVSSISKRPWFSKLYTDKQKTYPPNRAKISGISLIKSLGVSESEYWTSIDNLKRLGLASSYVEEGSIDFETTDGFQSSDVITSHGGYNDLCITSLGISFVKICNY